MRSPTRRTFLTRAAAASAVGAASATLRAGDFAMATKDEIRPVNHEARASRKPNLFLIEDLDDANRSKDLAQRDLTALRPSSRAMMALRSTIPISARLRHQCHSC